MQEYIVTQCLSTHPEYQIASANDHKPMINFAQSLRYLKVYVTAANEAEAIAKVRNDKLLPTFPEPIIDMFNRIWKTNTIYRNFIAVANINNVVVPTTDDLGYIVNYTLSDYAEELIKEINGEEK